MNVFVRDVDLHDFNRLDGRRLEVVVDVFPLWNGAQLATDTTMVSPVRRDGTARAGTATTDVKALDIARSQQARKYSELSGEKGRERLVVRGTEVGGRWSVSPLARPGMRPSPLEAVFVRRGSNGGEACWGALQSLLKGGVDGPTPSTNILGDARFG